jgi:iron(III) transport system substrate-binding protein
MTHLSPMIGSLLLFLILLLLSPAVLAQTHPDPKLVEGAKREREIVYYTTTTLDQSKRVVDRFEQKYPFIRTTLFRAGSGALVNKIFTEASVGRSSWDVMGGGVEKVSRTTERKLFASYRSSETQMIAHELVDKEGYWTAYYVTVYVLGWNTKLVKAEDVPRTYEALLNPKWKGLLSLDSEAYSMLTGLKRIWGRDKAIAYFKRLAAQEPVVKRGNTERVQLLAAGEYPLIIGYSSGIQRMISMGAPIDWVALEPAVTQAAPIRVGAKAPHPNAARLFVDFLLSKEGQEMVRGFQRIPVRKDVEPEPSRLFRGFKWVIVTAEESEETDASVKEYTEIFKLR